MDTGLGTGPAMIRGFTTSMPGVTPGEAANGIKSAASSPLVLANLFFCNQHKSKGRPHKKAEAGDPKRYLLKETHHGLSASRGFNFLLKLLESL